MGTYTGFCAILAYLRKARAFFTLTESITEDNALDCLKKKTEKRSVFQKKVSEFRINGKNTVAVLDIDDLKRHGSGAVDGIFGATGRAESAVAAKGNKLESATTVTTIHCATKRRIATSDHAVNIFNDCRAGMESINHFFIMIFENVLKYVTHKIIMNETQRENSPTPQRLRGRGVEVSKTLFYGECGGGAAAITLWRLKNDCYESAEDCYEISAPEGLLSVPAGSSTAMVVPLSELFSTQTEPPWRSAISHTRESPSPAPPNFRLRDLSTRKKGWKILR